MRLGKQEKKLPETELLDTQNRTSDLFEKEGKIYWIREGKLMAFEVGNDFITLQKDPAYPLPSSGCHNRTEAEKQKRGGFGSFV